MMLILDAQTLKWPNPLIAYQEIASNHVLRQQLGSYNGALWAPRGVSDYRIRASIWVLDSVSIHRKLLIAFTFQEGRE
jgi:hypothetical protein